MKENIVKAKSFAFAVKIVKLYQFFVETKREYVLSKQLLRCGTSVGAMVREAEHAETKNDFKHKLGIAQKEINEAIYWLELLTETDYLTKEQFESINKDAVEIIKIITSIIKTTKTNIMVNG
ncbi:MAG: four helix bundle protein [Bacteroidetes bacterium]|nr:four helix bundle protein [Bacteroidota bacterium]